jgi:hypothetical protein
MKQPTKQGWRVELNGQIFTAWDIIRLITSLEHEEKRVKGTEKNHVLDLRNRLQLATMGEAPKYMKLRL